ncbi:MAG: hypothetical protein ACI9UO_000744 [Nitrospinales bacterium]|jgi:hypothetical protein
MVFILVLVFWGGGGLGFSSFARGRFFGLRFYFFGFGFLFNHDDIPQTMFDGAKPRSSYS